MDERSRRGMFPKVREVTKAWYALGYGGYNQSALRLELNWN
jgi:hypothetical protein